VSDIFSAALDRLTRVPGVRGALIVETQAGIAVVDELAEDVHGSAVAALAASLFTRTHQASAGSGFGELRTIQLEGELGSVVMASAGELLVVVVAERAAQLGLIRLEAHRTAGALR
jgi:predicted regulator of Ras-like GTPase activity (Roadblock/LC7/MglB family)